MQLSEKDVARFWARVDKAGTDDCWLWNGTTIIGGYGVVTCQKRTTLATHVSLAIDGRPRPSSPANNALHGDTCASAACVNPNHLRWGTHQENMADKVRLGRQSCLKGRDHPRAIPDTARNRFRKLQVMLLPGLQREVAEIVGISKAMVADIRKDRRWRHIPVMPDADIDWLVQQLADEDARGSRAPVPGVVFHERKRAA